MHTRTRRTLPVLLTSLVAGAALVLTATPAQAARTPDPAVPATAGVPLTVTGNGYGHGRGMSQWGAKGAADKGLSTEQILAFYYPNTQPGSIAATIKVLITADTDNNLTVYNERGLRVRDLGNGRTYSLRHTNRTPRLWRLVQKHGHTKVFYRTSRWHLYKTAGRRSLAGDGEFRAPGGTTLKLKTGPRKYRGALRFTNSDTVNVLNMEKYLRGVIAAEMPASWAPAALRAQAVAARSYAAAKRALRVNDYYQICDTTACQVYGGVSSEKPFTDAAVAATAGRVLTSGGQVALTEFSSSNGGWTSTGGGTAPYLVAQADPYDLAVAPYHHWKAQIDPGKLQAAYPQIGTLTSVQIVKRESPNPPSAAEWGGWVPKLGVHVTGTGGSVPSVDISGDDFRRLYGLKSAYFTFAAVP